MTKEELGNVILASEDQMYRTARSLLSNDADCADAIQEAIVQSFAKLHTLKHDKYAKTWLIRILVNECYTIMRKEKKLTSLEVVPEQIAFERADYSDCMRLLANCRRICALRWSCIMQKNLP